MKVATLAKLFRVVSTRRMHSNRAVFGIYDLFDL